ncbi:uncharacterized protein LOC119403403 [Rhipicephalus sanguineus]|uniref:uncharacterized protein LOC119403403 n=1 Tax=Rhipicephalus sanguineus TaxID=34632 RepID=UPI0020C1E012|nr:uncharacterized protein LOC119403403 [Rhipicephalus sanguineus]
MIPPTGHHLEEQVALFTLSFCMFTGSLASMERKRSRAAARASSDSEDRGGELQDQPQDDEPLKRRIQDLEDELEEVREQLRKAQDCLDSARMVKRLKHMIERADKETQSVAVVTAPKVDIGDGVLVDEGTLSRLRRDAKDSGPRLARGLLKVLFSPEKLENKSLYGRKSNAHKNLPQKEALDVKRVNAILGMC